MKSKVKKGKLILKKLKDKNINKKVEVVQDSLNIPLTTVINPMGGRFSSISKKLKTQFKLNALSIVFNFDISPKKRISVIGSYSDKSSFTFNGRSYIKDSDSIYYNQTLKMNCVDYHIDFSLPIKRDLKVKTLLGAFEKDYPSVQYMLHPLTVKRWIETSLIQDLLQGSGEGDMSTMNKFMFLMISIILLVLLYMSGAFAKLGGMFS